MTAVAATITDRNDTSPFQIHAAKLPRTNLSPLGDHHLLEWSLSLMLLRLSFCNLKFVATGVVALVVVAIGVTPFAYVIEDGR